jgi:hypothetical protein
MIDWNDDIEDGDHLADSKIESSFDFSASLVEKGRALHLFMIISRIE